MKVVTRVKGLLAAAVAAAGLVAFAEPVVEITKAWQANPGSGVVDLTYEVRDVGTAPCDLIFRVEAKGCETTCTFTNSNVAAGVVTTNINYKAVLGGVYSNVSVYLSLAEKSVETGPVQLWEGGPEFASCNVGATKPEEYGWYFWWGDTVGYTNTGSAWIPVKDGTTPITFDNSSPANSTMNMDVSALQSAGYFDENKSFLNAAHDAATANLGAPWRMMTNAELDKLVDENVCTREWKVNYNGSGVNGFLFRGAVAPYSNNEVFFPAAGLGEGAVNAYPNSTYGNYWTSWPMSDNTAFAWYMSFREGGVPYKSNNKRLHGRPVRAVRDVK